MANTVKSVSGATTTYIITDNEGSTATITLTSTNTTGNQITSLSNSGSFHYDGMAAMSNLMLQLQTGLLP